MSPRLVAALALAGCGKTAPPTTHVIDLPHAPPDSLLTAAAFANVTDRVERSRALFSEMAKVLLHPRCVNCHTPDDSPRQGDAHELHDPPVARGPGDRGVVGMKCGGCHQDHNLELARVPGAPDWHLAPLAMVWLDRTPHEICEQIKDRARNGDRALADVHEHLAKDSLVAWGWSPGWGRTPAPGSQAQLGELAAAWIDTGAECPDEADKR